MFRYSGILTFLLLAAGGAQAQLVKEWRAVRSSHFELVSRYDRRQVEQLLADMEWLRAVFEKNHGVKYRTERRALVLVPDSPFDFDQMAPSGALGYYLGAPSRDLIVLKEMFGARHAALHELTHLTLHSESHHWPRWFNEGTSEFYGSARAAGAAVEAGAPNSRIEAIKKGAWIPVDVMLLRDPFEHLTGPDAVMKFYAQAWLYVNMLHMAPLYREKFAEFRKRMADGQESNQAIREVYGKPASEFDVDARIWFRQKRFPVEQLQPAEQQTSEMTARVLDEAEVDIVKATVAAHSGRNPDARRQYSAFSRRPGECEWQAALGDLAFAAKMFDAAVGHYKDATTCGVTIAEILEGVEFALHDRKRTPVRKEDTAPLLKLRGAERIHYLNGTAQFLDKDYEGALASFASAKDLKPGEQFRMTRMKIMALTELGKFSEARTATEELRSLARNTDERNTAALSAEDVERAEKAAGSNAEPFHLKLLRSLSRIDGDVVNVECRGDKPRFTVRSGGQTLKLVIDDPAQVVTGETAVQLEFGCGPQKRPATIGYLPQPDAASGAAGRIRYLEFR
jgi:hypothetical protein